MNTAQEIINKASDWTDALKMAEENVKSLDFVEQDGDSETTTFEFEDESKLFFDSIGNYKVI